MSAAEERDAAALEDALAREKDPAAQSRLHEELARRLRLGGDAVAARSHLEQALLLAQKHDEPRIGGLAAALGMHLLAAGLPQRAEPLLAEALRRAEAAEDGLTIVAAGTALAALRLHAEDWPAAERLGAEVAAAAAARSNWLGVADGLLTRATGRYASGDLRGALLLLLRGGRYLRAQGAFAALNLVKARMAELRLQVGEADFDPVFADLLAREEG